MLPIGRLAEATGCKIETIRYYEQIGLLPEGERTSGNQRRYTRRHLQILSFIRHARDLGFSVDAIRDLLKLSADPARPCAEADAIAAAHLADVRAKIARLRNLEQELERMTRLHCSGAIADCRVIEVLADHGKCMHDSH
ncbi:helix-turn-helix domain-containing protein [Chelatococcus sp. SYSU_G07232]|uniref:Helix-turn-helix domain-containing protein n=1 Tax=Chelatococcus albus TaxID=3047466 RepID=A0ABT7AH21_9HYPH|nr:helix-turn-helix domain-containing protein [Chelatococcus sp. SYSU_G07232]MDJ1158670.1 helix-turn-helix domain-containing protein [Chelatococcus sp. SYSU_G07232]